MTRRPSFYIAPALALVVAACSGVEASKGDSAAVSPSATADAANTDPRVAIADTARILGDPAAKVWLLMASDFQCPACKFWHDKFAAEIMRDYVKTGKVRFAYTNYPLDQHPNAPAAAEAAMCAAAQGRFWKIHDLLFARQDEWAPAPDPVPQLRQLAMEAGVDTVAWNQCLVDNVMVPLIEADRARGLTAGVNQTPYFFVGTWKIPGAMPAARMRPLLDSAIAQAGGVSR